METRFKPKGLSRTTAWRLGLSGTLVGRRFSSLVVKADSGTKNKIGERLWVAVCDCGQRVPVTAYGLRSGRDTHCGCGGKPEEQQREQKQDVGGLTAKRWAKIVVGAKRRNEPLPIDQKTAWELFLKQGRRCAVTGREISIERAALLWGPPRWVHRHVAKLFLLLPEKEAMQLAIDLAVFSGAARLAPQPKGPPQFEAEQFQLSLSE
jgi:hypothetical protein